MAAAGGYSLSIKAIDNVSGVLDRINAKIAASQAAATKQVQAAFAPWQRLGQSIGQTSKLLGVNKLAGGLMKVSTGFRDMAGHALDAFRNVARIVEPLGLITGALTVAGLYKLVTAFGQFGTQLKFTAQNIGIGITQLQGLQGAAQLAGVSAGALTNGLQGLGQTLYDAAGGRNTEAVALFTQLGISWRDGVGHAKSVMQVLPQLADKIAAMKDPYAQAQAAQIAFGGAAEEMLPFLRLGSKGIAEYNAAALKYGTITAKQAQAANDLRMSQVKLDLAVHGFVNTLAAQLAPVLTPILTWMADWIAANRQWLAQKISDEVGRLVTWLKGVDWKHVGSQIQAVWSDINDVVNIFGGWKDAAIGMVAVMGASWLASILSPLATIAGAVAKVVLSIAALPGVATAAAVAVTAAGIIDMVEHASTSDSDNYDTKKGSAAQAKATGNALRSVMRSHGMPDASIAGLFGNVVAESGGDPGIQQKGGEGYGLAQWSNARQAQFKQVEGVDIHGSTATQQAQFMWWELNQPEYAAVKQGLMSGKLTPTQAAALVEGGYEKPKDLGGPNGIGQRSLYANAWFNGLPIADGDATAARKAKADAPYAHPATPVANDLGFGGGPGRAPTGPPGAHDDHTGMYQSAMDGKWYPLNSGPAAPNDFRKLNSQNEAANAEVSKLVAHVLSQAAPDVPMPTTDGGATATAGRNGKVDINVKISHDGSIKTTTTAKGQNVNKPRVQTPMQANAA
jgi:hypothetical protein